MNDTDYPFLFLFLLLIFYLFFPFPIFFLDLKHNRIRMSRQQTASEETPLLSATTTADQALPTVSDNVKKASPWYVIVALFGLTFSLG